MEADDRFTRRSAVRLVGATAIGALVAGCGGPGEESDEDDETLDESWEDVDSISFEGNVDGWIAQSPSIVEGETNPTLEFVAGREYEIEWENADGEEHNLAIHDDLEGQAEETGILGEEGATAAISFEAATEMQEYMCELHPDDMVGDIEVYEE